MIPDEDEDQKIDFSFYYFIGIKKLNLSLAETGRLTLTTFNKLYKHYKDDFDIELYLRHSGKTYKQAFAEVEKKDDWF